MPLDDMEGLKQKQAEFEAGEEKKRQDAEEAVRVEAEAKKKAGESIKDRDAVLKDYKEIATEAEEMRAAKIEERIERAKEIKGTISERSAELEESSAKMEALIEQIRQVESLPVGTDGLEPGIQTELKEAKQEAEQLRVSIVDLKNEIGQLSPQLVDDETVERYQGLLTKMLELEKKIQEIESNIDVINLMIDEATTENGLRQQVVFAIEGAPSYRDDLRGPEGEERSNYLQALAQRYFQEEIDHRGINQIENPEQRFAATKELTENMVYGMRNAKAGYEKFVADLNDKNGSETTRQRLSGVALLNMAGRFGTADNLPFLDEDKKPGRNYTDGRARGSHWREAAVEHVGSINLILAREEGYGPLGGRITTISGRVNDTNPLRHTLSEHGFEYSTKGVVLPKETTPPAYQPLVSENEKPLTAADRERLTKDYTADEKAGEKYLDQQIERAQTYIDTLTEELAKLRKTDEGLDKFSKALELDGKSFSRLADLEAEVNHQLESLTPRAEQLRQIIADEQAEKFGLWGIGGGSARNERDARVKKRTADLAEVNSQIEKYNDAIKYAKSLAEQYPGADGVKAIDVKLEIGEATRQLQDTQRDLDWYQRGKAERDKK